jgi:hypothetical protein
MNDVTCQAAGALGVAVIGSIMNTVYSHKIIKAITVLPPEAAKAAKDSVVLHPKFR